MERFLSKIQLHPFVSIFIFTFYLYSYNADKVSSSEIVAPLIIGFFFICLELIIIKLITKDWKKSGFVTFLINIPLLNYGFLYDVFEKLYVIGYWPFHNIHRYLVVICCFVVVYGIIIVKRGRSDFSKLTYYLNVFYLSIALVTSVQYLIRLNQLKQNETNPYTSENKLIVSTADINPNVYFIILDGYANEHILKKHYGFDNSDFISKMIKYGFYNADSSCANYYSTLLSLNATMNLGYNYDLANTQKMLDDNLLFKELKSRNYKIVSLESGYAVTSGMHLTDSVIKIGALSEFQRMLLKYTVFKLDDMFGIFHYHRLKAQIGKLKEIAASNERNCFYFIHMVVPHPPYVLDKHGNRLLGRKASGSSWEPKEKYIDQLIYTNSVVQEFVSVINRKDTNAVIVIQSDHGPWISSSSQEEIFEARSMVLNLIHAPKRIYNNLYKKISSVNTFRALSPILIKKNIPLLKDSLAGKQIVYDALVFKKHNVNETN